MSVSSYHLISVLVNTMIAFFSAAFLVECSLYLFRIKAPRNRANIRLFPFVILLCDRIFSDFSFVNWLNPLSCNSCVQRLFPQLQRVLTESESKLVQFLALDNTLALGKLVAFGMFMATTLLVFRRLGQFYLNKRWLDCLANEGTRYQAGMINPKLASTIEQSQVQIIVSEKIQVPMATYAGVIILPKSVVEEVSREELEAILAHEWEHICWHDPKMRCFSLFVSTLFWWVPTKWWRNKVMEDQEMACDLAVEKYDLPRESLASSLLKVMNQSRLSYGDDMCFLATHRSLLLRRFHALLGTPPLAGDLRVIGFVGIGVELILFLTCLYFF